MKKQERISRQEEMLSLIEHWQESGKTQQSFCQEHDITFSTFYYWLKRYRGGIEESSFLPVEISSGSGVPSTSQAPDPMFNYEFFRYNTEDDTYTCPGGEVLRTNGSWYKQRSSSGSISRFNTAPVPATNFLTEDKLLAPIKLVPRSRQHSIKFVP